MEFGLETININRIREVFRKHPDVQEAIIYGSRAKGNWREDSDIDICLKGEIKLSVIYEIENQLDDLMLPFTFDISVFEKLDNNDLIDHIERVGKRFYTKEG